MNSDCDEATVTRRLRLCGVAATLPRSISLQRRLLRHHRLPQALLQLSVRKLDGSLFEVWVRKTATVAELKQAVEDVFLPSTYLIISWAHVWSNFCLSHQDQKLMADQRKIGLYGIKDGDQLSFVRHLSAKGNMEKIKMKHPSNALGMVTM